MQTIAKLLLIVAVMFPIRLPLGPTVPDFRGTWYSETEFDCLQEGHCVWFVGHTRIGEGVICGDYVYLRWMVYSEQTTGEVIAYRIKSGLTELDSTASYYIFPMYLKRKPHRWR